MSLSYFEFCESAALENSFWRIGRVGVEPTTRRWQRLTREHYGFTPTSHARIDPYSRLLYH
jgi:hypothetical protein